MLNCTTVDKFMIVLQVAQVLQPFFLENKKTLNTWKLNNNRFDDPPKKALR